MKSRILLLVTLISLISCAQDRVDPYAAYRWDGNEESVLSSGITLAQYLTEQTKDNINKSVGELRICANYNDDFGKLVLEYSQDMPKGKRGVTFFESNYAYMRITYDELWSGGSSVLKHELIHVVLNSVYGDADAHHINEMFINCTQ